MALIDATDNWQSIVLPTDESLFVWEGEVIFYRPPQGLPNPTDSEKQLGAPVPQGESHFFFAGTVFYRRGNKGGRCAFSRNQMVA